MSPQAEALAGALIDAGAEKAFQAEGVILFSVPRSVVEAYAEARLAKAAAGEVLAALIAAHFGQAAVAAFAENPRCVGLTIGRAWAARCSDLERRVRGIVGSPSTVEEAPSTTSWSPSPCGGGSSGNRAAAA